ncbi:MAG TPA: Ig-like domain-containing protein [Terracidiphilus sp.]|nr:Ig-like domain-containing protein [Terracidiphilus sp.]
MTSGRSFVQGASARGLATQTTLTTEVRDLGGRTHARLAVTVAAEGGQPAPGAVAFQDHGKPLAGAALDGRGHAAVSLTLVPGEHSLTAVYTGTADFQTSVSQVETVNAATGSTPDFSVSVAPATLSLTAGQSGSVKASVTPINAASLTAPMFVTLSCAGLPDQSSCSFTPENVEILPGATANVMSSLVLTTHAKSLAQAVPARSGQTGSVNWAIMLPGVFGLGGLAFGARRRRWLGRFALMALVGLVTVLGSTACSPLYNYRNHGPPSNLPTPSGNYTIQINAQSSNGITAITHNTTLALTVK